MGVSDKPRTGRCAKCLGSGKTEAGAECTGCAGLGTFVEIPIQEWLAGFTQESDPIPLSDTNWLAFSKYLPHTETETNHE